MGAELLLDIAAESFAKIVSPCDSRSQSIGAVLADKRGQPSEWVIRGSVACLKSEGLGGQGDKQRGNDGLHVGSGEKHA